MRLNLKDIYSQSWNIFTRNWWEYILVTFIMLVLLYIPFGNILQMLILCLMFNAVLLFVKNGSISFSDFFNFKTVLNPTVISIIVIIGLCYFGFQLLDFSALYIIFSIVYFIFAIILFPLFCVAIDKNLSLKDTVLYSAKLTKNIRKEILVIMIINFFIGLVGILIFFVGIFVAIPIVSIATVIVYKELEKNNISN